MSLSLKLNNNLVIFSLLKICKSTLSSHDLSIKFMISVLFNFSVKEEILTIAVTLTFFKQHSSIISLLLSLFEI